MGASVAFAAQKGYLTDTTIRGSLTLCANRPLIFIQIDGKSYHLTKDLHQSLSPLISQYSGRRIGIFPTIGYMEDI